MSAQVTEAHRELARRIMFEFTQAGTATASDVRMAAHIIADSEARACDQLRAEVERLRDGGIQRIKDAMAVVMDERDSFKARAERAEADADSTRERALTLANSLDEAQAELAAERARVADLVADLNDACITLASAAEDCDDYAMQNTGFKLTAVREVLLQHIPNAAMKEGA